MAWVNSSGKTIGKTAILMNEESVSAILVALFLVLVATFSIREHDPPTALSATVSPEVFSAGRAVQHLSVIAQKPHAVGTIEHKVVQEYLVKQLSEAGVEPQIERAIIAGKVGPPLQVAAAENVLARLKGTATSKAVLLVAHYDSTLNSFGATDDGSAVASLLETLRALKAGPPLKNDVIFLFTDGEEVGFLGARAFTTENPWIQDVGVVLNFDARGNSGPVMMFETSQNNGWLIDQFAHATPFPVAHSLSYELYRLLPNDTDLTLFKKAGKAGLNFANIDGLDHYHTPLDNLQGVDQNSMQHQGSYALALARQFGSVDLSQTRQKNAVYFDLFGRLLVHYSSAWVIPLTLIVTALFVAVLVLGFRRRKLTVSGIIVGFISLFVSLSVASLLGWLLWKLIWKIRPGPSAAATQNRILLFGFVALAIAITFAVYTFARNRAAVESLAMGGLLWWLLLMVLTSIFLPGASFIFHWPLLFSLIGIGWMMLSPQHKRTRSLLDFVVLSLCALPGIVLMAPIIYQIFVGLTLNWSFMVIALFVLLLGLLLPQLRIIATPFRWVLPGAAAVAAIALLVVGALSTPAAPAVRPTNQIYYALNVDTGKAIWASDLSQPDERTPQLFGGAQTKGNLADFAYKGASRQYTVNTAPVAQLPAPEMSVLEDKSVDGVRTLRMQVRSPRQAGRLFVYVDSNAEVLNASIDELPLAELRDHWGLQIEGIPQQGVQLQLQLKTSEPLKLRLVDQSYGLPPLNGASNSQFPTLVARPDATMLVKSFSL